MDPDRPRPRLVLVVIVIAQLFGTSVWFAGNAVIGDLAGGFGLPADSIGLVTSSVQLGFILGTLVLALFGIPDLIRSPVLFAIASIIGAATTAAITLVNAGPAMLVALRVATGIALAGVYPIGMRLAAGWYRDGLGSSLGLLVGALVLGTASPHLVRGLIGSVPWQTVLWIVSVASAAGGLAVLLLVPEGPHVRRAGRASFGATGRLIRSRPLRAAAFGYFGHMWELYAFWAFVPILISRLVAEPVVHPSLLSAVVIGSGAAGCVVGGIVSRRVGSARVAGAALAASGLLCLGSPLLWLPVPGIVLPVLVFWGIVVVGDSPQFSALIAAAAPQDAVGTALTLVNSIGFAISIGSIGLLTRIDGLLAEPLLLMPLAAGPVLGLLALRHGRLAHSR